MAIFDFVKQAGETLAGVIEKASVESLKAKVQESGIENKDLALKWLDNETLKVYAVVTSVEDKEKLVLLLGNVNGVGKVEDAIKVRDSSGTEVTAAPVSRFYTVKTGDTLSGIAASHLGSADRYMEIFEMNRPMLSNPDSIDVGQTLRLPKS